MCAKRKSLDRAFERHDDRLQRSSSSSDPFTYVHRRQILALATKHRMPDMYRLRENVELGGLMAYGVDSPSHVAPRRGVCG